MHTKRITYIDAMRGLTMVLVVYSHVCSFCLGDRSAGFNDVLFLFRLPCFFFISGWLFYKADRVWTMPTIRQVVRQKFMVQIVPTFIFLVLLVMLHDGQPPSVVLTRLGATKGGYWFTFALFEFFIIYILSVLPFHRRPNDGAQFVLALTVSVAAFYYDAYYNRLQSLCQPSPTPSVLPCLSSAIFHTLGFLSFMTWRYYLFFFIGTWARRHFHTFIAWTDKPTVIAAVCCAFGTAALVPHTDSVACEYLLFALGGVSGLTLVFTLFRRLSPLISHSSSIVFLGRRTLDVYLLHYFFLFYLCLILIVLLFHNLLQFALI